MFLYHTLSALLCALFIPVVLGVGESPHPKKTYTSPKRLPNCVLFILFFGRRNQGRRHGFESGGDKFCERSEQKIFF